MIRRDAEVIWRPGRLYVPVTQFSGLQQKAFTPAGTNSTSNVTGNVIVKGGAIGEATGINPDSNAGVLSKAAATDRTIPIATYLGATPSAAAQTFTGTAVSADSLIVSAGTSNAPLVQVNSLGLMALKMSTNGMDVRHYMALPYDVDINHTIYTRLHWTSDSTTNTDAVQWTTKYLKVIVGTTAIITPATALDVVVPSSTVPGTTAYIHQATGWGELRPASTVIADNVEFIHWLFTMTTKTFGGAGDVFLLGAEFRYTPKRLAGVDGMRQPAKPGTYTFSKEYQN